MKTNSKNSVIKVLSLTGQMAEHKSEKMQEHGMNEDDLLLALSTDEQDTLVELLKKLQDRWVSDHKKRMANNKAEK